MRTRRAFAIATLVALASVASCASQPEPQAYSDAPGFLSGLLHGFSAPVTLLFGWLWEARIYAFPNSGWFYDLGFMIGISLWGGGAAAGSR